MLKPWVYKVPYSPVGGKFIKWFGEEYQIGEREGNNNEIPIS